MLEKEEEQRQQEQQQRQQQQRQQEQQQPQQEHQEHEHHEQQQHQEQQKVLLLHIQKNNHKVLFVKRLDSKEDVYCLQVEKYHNFAISAGVIVHNCGMLSYDIGQGALKDLVPQRIDGLIREVIPFGTDVNHEFNETGIETVLSIVNSMIGPFINKFNEKFNKHYPQSRIDKKYIEDKSKAFDIDYVRVVKSLGSLGGGKLIASRP